MTRKNDSPADHQAGTDGQAPPGPAAGHRVHTHGQPLPELIADLDAARERVEDAGAGAVLVLALGPATTAPWPGPGVAVHEVNKWERALRRVERLDAPVIAVAEGSCAGPAADMLLVADVRIARTDLRIALPRNDDRCWPGMALYRLVHQYGVARSRRIVLGEAQLTAERALAMGLVDEVTHEPQVALDAALATLRTVSGTDWAIRRRLLLEAHDASFEDALGAHLAACDRELQRLRAGELREVRP
ncbi:enoyl-CoA-hydratase DpgB [Streptomyces sp. YGL11-2]|uniref:enoyl-CoA-hydratase DpgB n=1 Tax=Streptomyces sp. YGL11-2 TaxID=3414028 RepID=UPI003CF6BE81